MILLSFWLACSEPEVPNASVPTTEVERLERETTLGPITAKVALSPKEPKLGEAMTMVLEVKAQEKVEVELPPFGEALGRFQIVSYEPMKKDEEGIQRQTYTLQAPMSGVQTIPSLRIVFFDKREDKDAEEQELLTDELTVEIASLLEEDAPLDFHAPRGRLEPEIEIPTWVWIGGSLVLLVGLSALGYRVAKNRRAHAVVRSAYEQAMDGLLSLSKNELEIDEYYAELSFILRRYIDARFGIPVLDKTTPEFLQIAKDSDVFHDEQLVFLKAFLQRADDVKYAQQQPDLGEEETEITLIRRFLEETKLVEEEA